jgi:hypothetical protein
MTTNIKGQIFLPERPRKGLSFDKAQALYTKAPTKPSTCCVCNMLCTSNANSIHRFTSTTIAEKVRSFFRNDLVKD